MWKYSHCLFLMKFVLWHVNLKANINIWSMGGSKFSKPDYSVTSSSKESNSDQQNKSDVLKTLKNKLRIGNSKEEASKKSVCFKCQGLGHVSKVCPNRTMVTR
ncbi:Chaperone protein DnaJ [Bienertia sinuspersici]